MPAALDLVGKILSIDGERVGVRHFEHRGHAAHHRAQRSRFQVLLVGLAGLAKMHLGIHHAGQDVQTLAVDDSVRAGRAERPDFGDTPARDADIAHPLAVLIDHGAGF